jgi:hypothetical protein
MSPRPTERLRLFLCPDSDKENFVPRFCPDGRCCRLDEQRPSAACLGPAVRAWRGMEASSETGSCCWRALTRGRLTIQRDASRSRLLVVAVDARCELQERGCDVCGSPRRGVI